jgi:hypothetical protein
VIVKYNGATDENESHEPQLRIWYSPWVEIGWIVVDEINDKYCGCRVQKKGRELLFLKTP